jgi:putative aldouronate transport system permease protein
VLDTFVYYQAIVPQEWGIGAAAGLFKGAIGLLLLYVSNQVAHRLGERGLYSRS